MPALPMDDGVGRVRSLVLVKTPKYSSYSAPAEPSRPTSAAPSPSHLPLPRPVPLLGLFTRSGKEDAKSAILGSLKDRGYALLTYPKAASFDCGRTEGKVIEKITNALRGIDSMTELKEAESGQYASDWIAKQAKVGGGEVYFNERDVPMYKLGFDDGTGGVKEGDTVRTELLCCCCCCCCCCCLFLLLEWSSSELTYANGRSFRA